MATNWSSFAGDEGGLKIEGCEVTVHLPVKNPAHCVFDLMIPFMAGGGKKGAGGEEDIAGPKAFTFERLLSIFSQISIAGGGSGSSSSSSRGKSSSALQVAKAVESRYGDAQLFAAVNDLEAQKYLTRASGWTLEKPLYVSAVQEGMARDISASVGFDLNAYLQ